MGGSINFAQIMISILLFMVLFFGIGFIVNMLLRSSWAVAIAYPIIVILIIDDVHMYEYVTDFQRSVVALKQQFLSLRLVDIVILSSGFLGAIISGIVIRILRARGYQMF